MSGIVSSIVYFVIGMVFCAIGYKVLDMILPLDLNKEIDNHNIAAGLTVAGMFIGIALIIATTIA